MAGSRVYRQYTDDAGDNYAIVIDESNAEATVNGEILMPPRTSNIPHLPKGLTPRYVLAFLQTNPEVKRKFKVGGVVQINQLLTVGAIIQANAYPTSADITPVSEDFVVTFYSGEKRKLIPAVGGNTNDTGLTDGDPD